FVHFTVLSLCSFLFLIAPHPTDIYTLSLHDALPIAGSPVEMLPASFGDQTLEHYRWADTSMVTLRSDWASFAHTVPSKTYELLSYGKHITGVVCGEAAAILQQAGQHEITTPDPNAVAQA